MKEQKWDEPLENAKEIFDIAANAVEEEDVDESPATGGSQFTELRRRIEERMDSKRIAHEYDWDDLDEITG